MQQVNLMTERGRDMDTLSPDLRDQLLGAMIEMWRCPECGATSFTHKSQGALMLRCPEDHGSGEIDGMTYKRLVWMQKVTPQDATS